MLNAFLLITIILFISGQNVTKKFYTRRCGSGGVYLFNTILSAAAMLFFVVTSSGLHFRLALIPYALAFGIAYLIGSVFAVLALAEGSLSLSALLISYSLMLPTLYGLLFLDDPIGIGLFPGIGLLLISLLLINKKDGEIKLSLKWFIYVGLAFLGNGFCTIFQKMQQVAFNGAYKNETMILALAFVTLAMALFSLITERKELRKFARHAWLPSLLCGIFNGIVNLFVMILSGRMAASMMFPLISAGGIVLTFLISKFVYKERLTKTQYIGFTLGTAAVVLLNL